LDRAVEQATLAAEFYPSSHATVTCENQMVHHTAGANQDTWRQQCILAQEQLQRERNENAPLWGLPRSIGGVAPDVVDNVGKSGLVLETKRPTNGREYDQDLPYMDHAAFRQLNGVAEGNSVKWPAPPREYSRGDIEHSTPPSSQYPDGKRAEKASDDMRKNFSRLTGLANDALCAGKQTPVVPGSGVHDEASLNAAAHEMCRNIYDGRRQLAQQAQRPSTPLQASLGPKRVPGTSVQRSGLSGHSERAGLLRPRSAPILRQSVTSGFKTGSNQSRGSRDNIGAPGFLPGHKLYGTPGPTSYRVHSRAYQHFGHMAGGAEPLGSSLTVKQAVIFPANTKH
jgi:hypothetical protein